MKLLYSNDSILSIQPSRVRDGVKFIRQVHPSTRIHTWFPSHLDCLPWYTILAQGVTDFIVCIGPLTFFALG
jgi:hypothetical protein